METENKSVLSPRQVSSFLEQLTDFHVAKSVLEKLVDKVSHNPGEEIEIADEHRTSGHRYGDGGEMEQTTLMKHHGKIVILSTYFQSYETYSDDSEDYSTQNHKNTYLLENDPLARTIFDDIVKLKNMPVAA